jgi:hypothetical protein
MKEPVEGRGIPPFARTKRWIDGIRKKASAKIEERVE